MKQNKIYYIMTYSIKYISSISSGKIHTITKTLCLSVICIPFFLNYKLDYIQSFLNIQLELY